MAIQLKATKQYFPVVLFIMPYNFEVREVLFVYNVKKNCSQRGNLRMVNVKAICAYWFDD